MLLFFGGFFSFFLGFKRGGHGPGHMHAQQTCRTRPHDCTRRLLLDERTRMRALYQVGLPRRHDTRAHQLISINRTKKRILKMKLRTILMSNLVLFAELGPLGLQEQHIKRKIPVQYSFKRSRLYSFR